MQNEQILSLNILSHLYGHKKAQILLFICKNLDEDLRFFGTYADISEATGASKPTIVSLFKSLQNIHLLKKEKNGLYRFSPKIKENL